MRVRAAWGAAFVGLTFGPMLASCGNDAATPSTVPVASSGSSTSTTAATPAPEIEAVIDVGGTQLLGLAVTSDAVWAVSFDAGTISRVDPETNAAVATIPLAGAATVLAVGETVWAASYASPTDSLIVIDASTDAVTGTIDAGELCCDLTSDGASVWAIDPAGQLLRVADGEVAHRLPIEVDARNAHTNGVFAGGFVWVSSDTTPLHKVVPDTGATDDIDVGGGVPFVAHDGLLWGASPTEVWAVDPATGAVIEQISLARSTEVLSLNFDGDGDLWVGIRRPGRVGAVLEIDRATSAVKKELRDIEIPARIESGFGSIWITDSASSSLYRLAS